MVPSITRSGKILPANGSGRSLVATKGPGRDPVKWRYGGGHPQTRPGPMGYPAPKAQGVAPQTGPGSVGPRPLARVTGPGLSYIYPVRPIVVEPPQGNSRI